MMGYVHDSDILPAMVLPEVDGEEDELTSDWDAM